MRDTKKIKPSITKNLTKISFEDFSQMEKLVFPLFYQFARSFLDLTPKQRYYILQTIENLKKHHL